MASYQHILFEHWTSQEVANWLQGLDDSVAQYVPLFKVHAVNGRKLLMLNHSDLEKMGINKLGHQELVLEAVDLLRSLRYTLDTENLQSMALQLGCKARNLVAEILMRQGENDRNRANRGEMQRKRLSITVLSYVADLLATLKNLVSWLDRAPFEGIYDICRLRNFVVKIGLELVTVTQRESSCINPEDAIIKSCRVLIEHCNGLVQNTKDPLVIQPAALEQATIRKKQGEELGMNIQSAYNGIHGISSIKDLSPADMCSKIEKGDEVLQVNGQTVLGWQLKELVKILKDRPKEVTLLLKKRPRHINPLGAMQNHKKLAAKHAQQAATLPKSLKKRRSREGDVLKQVRPSLQEFVSGAPAGDEIFITKDTPDTPGDGNDTDNDVFRSGSESPQYTLPVMPDAKQRRATVSGGSPTFERNSLMVEDPVIRPKSQVVNMAERDAALAVLAAAENNLKTRVAESGIVDGEAVESGREDRAAKAGNAILRKTSSESSGGQKGPSESEMEDSVFSSDKEDKEQQNTSIRAAADTKRQEFRVAKPTPMLLDPNTAATATATPSSPSTPSPNTPTPTPSPNTPTPTPSPNTPLPTPITPTPKIPLPIPPTPPARNSSTSSSISSTSSSSTLINSPSPGGARLSRSSGSVPPPVPPRKPSLTSKPAVPAKPTLDRSKLSQERPPSPVSAPPKRKKAVALGFSHGGGQSGSVKSNMSSSEIEQTASVSGPLPGMRTASSSDVDSNTKPSSATSSPRESVKRASNPTSSGLAGSEPSALLAKDVNSETRGSKADNHSPRESDSGGAKTPADATSSVKQAEPEVNMRGDKGKPGGVLEMKGIRDTRSQAAQLAVQTEVATDVGRDMPQLMKINKLESPKATDCPNPLSIALSDTPKQKKKVEFSVDSKESSPPHEVSYTHIVVGGVVQKIPVEKSHSDSQVKMRPKTSASRRLDRRVSCKDLGKGDCEGWLHKRKERDRTLAKHWNKRWCVLKNSNLYYYKNKDDLKAEGVIFLPAFQVSPAPTLKTKKLAFKVHNAGTTFYFASERQDDMSKWMNKMGLAAISFDPSHTVTTAGFIKPEVRSNHLGVANIYYSESEDEIDDGGTLKDGSTLSLNSISSQGSTSTTASSHHHHHPHGPPPPPAAKPVITTIHSDPSGHGSAAGSGSDSGSGSGLAPQTMGHQTAAAAAVGGSKEDQCPESREDLHCGLLRTIHSQDLTIDGVDRHKRRTQHLSCELVDLSKKIDKHVRRMKDLLALKRTMKMKEQEVQDIDRLLASHITASRLRDFFARHPSMKKL